jgi:hypothetical protein
MSHREAKTNLITSCEYIGVFQEMVDPDTVIGRAVD